MENITIDEMRQCLDQYCETNKYWFLTKLRIILNQFERIHNNDPLKHFWDTYIGQDEFLYDDEKRKLKLRNRYQKYKDNEHVYVLFNEGVKINNSDNREVQWNFGGNCYLFRRTFGYDCRDEDIQEFFKNDSKITRQEMLEELQVDNNFSFVDFV